jgi:Kef-type K+ transport system membrane component KefB/nucleotide-binding universal stress UspA family protein
MFVGGRRGAEGGGAEGTIPLTLRSLSDHDLGVLFTQLAALLLLARALGVVSRRLGQPAVIGELVAGLVLGPSVFGKLWPAGFHWFLPAGSAETASLMSISELSLVVLLVVIGAETDLRLIASLGQAAAWVSASSLLVPAAAGAALGWFLPDVLLGPHHARTGFTLLIAGAVGVSSLPVIAKIVTDLGMARRNFGQLIFAAGTVNDVAGFLIVAAATAMAVSSGSASPWHMARVGLALVLLVLVAWTAGQRLVNRQLRTVLAGGSRLTSGVAVWLAGALIFTAAFQVSGVEGALGAFLFGLLLGRSRFKHEEAERAMTAMSSGLFAPLYFSTAGLRVDVASLRSGAVLASFIGLVVVGATAKFAGAAGGAALARLPRREWTVLGFGLNGRGALQVILATAGLRAGLISTTAFSLIILMSIITSLGAPPLLRAAARGWTGTREEQDRLGHESEMEKNLVVRGQRVLIPSRGSPNSIVAAEVIAAAWPEDSEVTLLTIGSDDHDLTTGVRSAEAVMAPRPVDRRHISSDDVLEEILAEARLGYGVVAVGAAESPGPGRILSPVVDDLLARAELPTVVVRRSRGLDGPLPGAFARALVAVAGSASSRAGQEVLFRMSRQLGTQASALHVVTRTSEDRARRARTGAGAGRDVLTAAVAHGRELGVDVRPITRHSRLAGEAIVETATGEDMDLIVMGATARTMEGRPFLGHTVEYVLENAACTVVVVVLPDPAPVASPERAVEG